MIVLYVVIVGGIAFYAYEGYRSLLGVWENAEDGKFLRVLFFPSLSWVVALTLLMAVRTLLWVRYRPTSAPGGDSSPMLSVVIPAYNEGPLVARSISSVLEASYPPGKLELLVVDDGSTDDTWEYIAEAAARFPDRVSAVRFPENRGKRSALACGFERARGEIVVTVDSDSLLDSQALLAIVAPFDNPRVGAVAGKVTVLNTREGVIPRMLHTRFLLTFDMLRAGESAYGTVYCCPGALTAYRVSAVREVLPRWLAQRFLGSTCTFGEDRALTNYLLDSGFDTVYQGSAEAKTVVPVSFSKLCRMILRWDRSYIREELRFMRIVWKRPALARWIAFFDRFLTNLRFPVGYLSLALLGAAVAVDPLIGVRFLIVIGLVSMLLTLYALRSEASLSVLLHGVLFAYLSTFGMLWIMPYALLTLRHRGWLTR